VGALLALGDAGVRTEREIVGQEAEGPLTPWQEVGSRGLDTWFELSVRQDIADGSGGEPDGSYVHSSSVKDYLLAALEGGDAHDEGYGGYYYAWLKYVLRRLRSGRKVR
jgi:hypothetical protein